MVTPRSTQGSLYDVRAPSPDARCLRRLAGGQDYPVLCGSPRFRARNYSKITREQHKLLCFSRRDSARVPQMDDALEFFEERAAILQFEAGRSRAEAEILAMVLTCRYCQRRGIDLPTEPKFRALLRIDAEWKDDIGGVVTRNGNAIPKRKA